MTKLEQEAYDRLCKTLNFSEDVDLFEVLNCANIRIHRLQDTLVSQYPATGLMEKFRKRMHEAEATLAHIISTLNNPHDHDFQEIEQWARDWQELRGESE